MSKSVAPLLRKPLLILYYELGRQQSTILPDGSAVYDNYEVAQWILRDIEEKMNDPKFDVLKYALPSPAFRIEVLR
jgi:hypothetical protein